MGALKETYDGMKDIIKDFSEECGIKDTIDILKDLNPFKRKKRR